MTHGSSPAPRRGASAGPSELDLAADELSRTVHACEGGLVEPFRRLDGMVLVAGLGRAAFWAYEFGSDDGPDRGSYPLTRASPAPRRNSPP